MPTEPPVLWAEEKIAKANRMKGIFLAEALSFLLTEVFLCFLVANPALTGNMPLPVLKILRNLYISYDRKIIQYETACTQYDPELTYTLRPGKCSFGNREFHNDYEINRLGVRDDEASLEAPEVVLVGDSHSMGWGVDQDKTYAQILERRLNMKILNAAISSYSTPREMLLLNRIDTSRLHTLVFQYHDNDYKENKYFYESGNVYHAMSEAGYEKEKESYRKRRRYFPGKYTLATLADMLRGLGRRILTRAAREAPPPPAEAVFLFLNAFSHSPVKVDLEKVRIIFFRIGEYGSSESEFLASLERQRLSKNFPPFVRRMKLLELAGRLDAEVHFYRLDDHLNAAGHKALADVLFEAIRENQRA